MSVRLVVNRNFSPINLRPVRSSRYGIALKFMWYILKVITAGKFYVFRRLLLRLLLNTPFYTEIIAVLRRLHIAIHARYSLEDGNSCCRRIILRSVFSE